MRVLNAMNPDDNLFGSATHNRVQPTAGTLQTSKQVDALANALALPLHIALPLSTVFESLPIATLLHDGQTVCHANRAAAELLGETEAATIIGRAVPDVLPTASVSAPVSQRSTEHLPDQGANEMGNSSNGATSDVQLKRRDGAPITVQMTETAMDIAGRTLVHVLLQENDEQLRRHQEELAHAGRLSTMGELVASIAHEINQPLYAISNYAGACQNALTDSSEASLARVARWTREIATQARRAGDIIARLGDFVRKAPPHRSTLNLNNLVIDSLDLLRFEIRRHKVRMGIELASPAPLVLADRVQIQQVIVNLIRNAFDALENLAPSKRRVAIVIQIHDLCISTHVEDGGKGLTQEEHAMLFQPFFTTKERGMGMGLAISRSIIEFHGGRLWATRNPEAGATFHFELPRLPTT